LTERAETSNVKRLILLLALTATTIAILWYGFTQGDRPEATMPDGSRLLWLVAILLAAVTAAVSLAPVVGDRAGWWAKAIRLVDRIPPIWYLLATGCVTSFVIAQVANTQPAPRNYWPLFALWLIVLGAVVISCVSGVRWSDLHPVSLKERLWPYRWELAIIAGLTAIAATLRVVNLTTIPLPFEQDEAAMAHESLHVVEGQTKNMFMSGLQGHPTMQFFIEAAFLKIFGVNVFAIRLISAVAGALSIPLLYLFLRQMFGRTIALLGATYLVGYHLHIAFSRIGMENIGDSFLMMAVFYFAWRASRGNKTTDFVLTGLVMGLGLYLYQGSRVVPFIVIAFFAYVAIRRPAFLRQAVPGMGMLVLAYAVAALPVAVFWFTHHSFFMDRIETVGIFQSGWIDQEQAATGRSVIAILWDQAVHSFGGFVVYPENGIFYRSPIPFVDALSLIPFLLGLAYALYRILDERYALLLGIFASVVVTGGILTVDPPMGSRLMGTVPAVVALIAIGLKLIGDWLSRLKPITTTGPAIAGLIVIALVATNVHFYFFDYRTGGYSSDLNNRVAGQVVDYVRTVPEETRLFWYGAPRMYMSGSGHPAMTFPLRERPRFDVLEDGEVRSNPELPLSGEAPALFMFLPHRQDEMAALIDSCPGGEVKTFISKAGRKGLNGVQEKDETSFVAYEVLTPNRCLPLTASMSNGG
jgi:4-amino-4-deoxy-L-arabinose transferase-like glycosyltransferase